MSSRATKRRIWRRVRQEHGWRYKARTNVMECWCGEVMTRAEIVRLGDIAATWQALGHIQDAYRAEQRKEARRCP